MRRARSCGEGPVAQAKNDTAWKREFATGLAATQAVTLPRNRAILGGR